MPEEGPNLRAALHGLDQEYEEGDITEKGYQKRRSMILSRYSMAYPNDADGFQEYNANTPDHGYGGPSDVGGLDPNRRYQASQLAQIQERELGFPIASNTQNQLPMGSQDNLFVSGTGLDPESYEASRSGTLMSQNYAFTPSNIPEADLETRQSSMLDYQQAYFSDFASQGPENFREGYGSGYNRYSQSEMYSAGGNMPPPAIPMAEASFTPNVDHLLPLEPRDIPFSDVKDPHDPDLPMSKFDNLPQILRHRARTHPKQPAYWVLDPRGKEIVSITWEKFGSRAEKVAQVIRDKSNLYRGDRVALVYRDNELIEFAVALMGCFIAGVVAVPINNLEDFASLNVILTSTQSHLALTTESNLKTFQRDITTQRLHWPRGVEWWKTNEFGSYHPKKKDEVPPLVVPDLAYIEFSRAPTGDLRGVVLSHRTLMHQMACLSAMIASAPSNGGRGENTRRPGGEILMSYLDPRQSIGMILGVFLSVYGGHTTIWFESQAVETPGLYASLITKFKATLLAADYPGLKRAVYNYQQDPFATRNFKKHVTPNFSSLKLCLIDTLTIDSEFHEVLADRWLRPLQNPRSRDAVAAMLCLPEHGGMIISTRDWLGGEERLGCPLEKQPDKPSEKDIDAKKEEGQKKEKSEESKPAFGSSLIGGGASVPAPKETRRDEFNEVLLDKEALKSNEVVILAMGEEARRMAANTPNSVSVGAFGYPLADATLAIVDPETGLLCTPKVIGEIWVDSPSLSGGFWALPKHTETIFHARPYRFFDGSPTPVAIEPEFLRTGLLGCIISGKLFVFGLYEDRLRQKVEWVEHGVEIAEHRYFFVQHLILSIMKNIPKIHDCSAFDVFVNEEHLPVVLLESYAASTAPTTNGGPPRPLDPALLDSLAERCMEVLYREHHLRVYCVMITAPNTLPRVTKNGRQEIGNMLCRREYDNGSLPCVHVKFGVESAVMNIPVGIDPAGGVWSTTASAVRQEALAMQEKQYSGVDIRDVIMDDRTSTPLNNFSSIVDLLQWRVTRQADELCICTIDSRTREGKGVTWKKFDTKVAAVAAYLKNKVKLRQGDHAILMYTHSEDFVYAVHACFCLGIVAVLMAPVDSNRLSEDVPAFLHLIADFSVKAVLVNGEVNELLKQKLVSQHIRQSAGVLHVNVPRIYSTSRPPKQSHGCRHLGFTLNEQKIKSNQPALVWTYWTPDQRRLSVHIGHDTILGMCKVQKETCQMSSSRPVLGSVRSTVGLGFIHTCLMGCYVGAPTYLVSPVDFAANPMSLFLCLARYKIKDTYATNQMLGHAMAHMTAKGFQLHELKNLMISAEGRARTEMYQKVRLHFATAGLDRNAINTVYSHVLNPMITSRSYMCIEPIELWLDTKYLRQGYIYPVEPGPESSSLLVQDSGMVPVSTQIAVVNPETCYLSHVGEYGEIWVQSEACAKAFYGSKQEFDQERFRGKIIDGDPNAVYVRTGDLGFLHTVTRPIGPGGQPVEMQVLFVLGGVGETFEINGLNHFPMDIERTIEKCHRNIVPGGSAVFQAGGLTVALVEVTRRAYLASMVPVIVNNVLNEHQIVTDIIAFVPRGDFPRSRLGEKQRGKILGSWVAKKLRTIAQFSIRESFEFDIKNAEAAERNRTSKTSSLIEGAPKQSNTFSDRDDYSVTQANPTDLSDERIEEHPEQYTGQYSEQYNQQHPDASYDEAYGQNDASHENLDNSGMYGSYNPYNQGSFHSYDHPHQASNTIPSSTTPSARTDTSYQGSFSQHGNSEYGDPSRKNSVSTHHSAATSGRGQGAPLIAGHGNELLPNQQTTYGNNLSGTNQPPRNARY